MVAAVAAHLRTPLDEGTCLLGGERWAQPNLIHQRVDGRHACRLETLCPGGRRRRWIAGAGTRFLRLSEPGDELELVCELDRVRGPIGRGKAEARVGGELAARATLTFAVER